VRPSPSEYLAYFDRYISLVPEEEIVPVLTDQATAIERAGSAIPEAVAGYRYAEGKWSVREVLGHLIDAERVFGYRALRIARGDRVSLPSFDENAFAAASGHDRVPLGELVEELRDLRRSHVHMFRHFSPEAWARIGLVNDHPASARAAAYILVGHVRHHARVLEERYAVPFRV
jgi:hypothetical protein